MSNQINHSLPYPAGYMRYAFTMHVAFDRSINCNSGHSNVTEMVFEKVTPTDPLNAEWQLTIHVGAVMSIEEVRQIGNAVKDDVLDTVSVMLNTKVGEVRVEGNGLTPRAGEGGIAHLMAPLPQVSATGDSGGYQLSSTDVQAIQAALAKMFGSKKKTLMRLFRDAVSTHKPLVQFLILYLILDILHCGSQETIDRFIMSDSPNTPQTPSQDPRKKKKGVLETIYTRLRNEIAHREHFALDSTGTEIRNCLDEFRNIVNRAVKKCV